MVSFKRIKLSIPDEKASSLVLIDADSPFCVLVNKYVSAKVVY